MKNSKVLTVLFSILIVAVAIEGYYIYQMSKQLNDKNSYYQPVKPISKNVPSNNQTVFNRLSSINPNIINPFKEFQKMQEEMNKVFGSFNAKFFNDPDFDKFFQDFSVSPMLDMKDMGDKYVINVEIPGSKKNSIKISVKDHTLKISAKMQTLKNKKGSHYLQKERFVGNFEREITLPQDADEDSLKTKYINGILVITIKKRS